MRAAPLLFCLVAGALGADPVLDLEGEGLDVLGSSDATSAVLVIDRQTIEDLRAADVPELLERALGLVTVSNGGYGSQSAVRLRGLGSGRVAILIDGVPVNSAQSGDFDLSRVAVASVQKVEVIPGGADSQYNINGAMGGVVNLITVGAAEGTRWGGSVSNRSNAPSEAAASPFDTQAFDLHVSWGDGVRFVNAGVDGHRANQGTRSGVLDAGAWLSFGADPVPGQRLLVSTNGYVAEKHIPGPLHSAPSAAGLQKETNTRTAVIWSAGAEEWSTDLTLSHRLTGIDWSDAAGRAQHWLQTGGVADRWSWSAASWFDLDTALDLDTSLLVSDSLGTRTDASGGLALTGRATVAKGVRVVPSIKAQWGQGLEKPIPVPKLGLEFRSDRAVLQVNGYRVFKLPTLNDRYWPDDGSARGNPHLKPEDGWGGDVGLTFPLPAGSGEATAYATRQTDAILWQPVGGKWTPTNVGQAAYAGGTLGWGGEAGPLSWSARYEYLMTWVLSDGFNWNDGKRMPYTPVHSGSGVLTWRTSRGTATLSVHGESERFLSPLNLYSLPSFWTLNAGWTQPLGGWELFLDGKNLLNASYMTVDGYPMPGASLTVGARFAVADYGQTR